MPARAYPTQAFTRFLREFGLPEPQLDRYVDVIETVYFASQQMEEGETIPLGVVIEPEPHCRHCTP